MDSKAAFNIDRYFGYVAKLSLAVTESPAYEEVIQILLSCYLKKGVVFTMGCGGSASTATHFAADLAKTTMSKGKPLFKTMALVDNVPLVSAWTNDEGWGRVFTGQLDPWITQNDVLIGFSVHGGSGQGNAGPWSQNLVAAMKLAKDRKAKIIGFSGFDGGAMKEMADASLVVPIKDEVYGTAVVEAMHVVLHHGLIFDLKERIKNGNNR